VSAIRRRLARQDGMTLIELMVASTIGTIVILAAYMVLDRSITLSNEVTDRADALQRGRLTLELMTRELRSQVCLGEATEPITDGRTDTVSFYADTGDGSTNPEERKLTYYASAATVNGVNIAAKSLTESRYTGNGVYPDLLFPSYPATPARFRVIGTRLRPVKVGTVDQPIFTYYAWDDDPSAAPGTMEKLAVPLSAADVARAVMVRVQFVTEPNRTKVRDQDSVTLTGDAYVRSADPSKPKDGPKCL
jgi:prepilin-type N-terminal cleavage/methylation domain-containing protein